MNVYRCYFLHARDRIGAFENIEARELDEVVDRAHAMLRQRPKHRAFEIWEGPNRLYPARSRITRSRMPISDPY